MSNPNEIITVVRTLIYRGPRHRVERHLAKRFVPRHGMDPGTIEEHFAGGYIPPDPETLPNSDGFKLAQYHLDKIQRRHVLILEYGEEV